MQRSLTISMILAVIAILSVSLTVAARSEALNLLEGDTLQISCEGSKLTLNQTSETEATANCEIEQVSLAVTSLILIDADADQEIGPLIDGDILNLAELPTRNLNIRADTNPAIVGSVRFELNSPDNARYENIAPYTLAGDSNGDYQPMTLATGEYTLTAIPFSESRGGGVAGTALSVSFIVIDEDGGEEPVPPAPPTDPEPNPGPDPQPTDPPTSSVPACPDHDPTQWHGLFDAQRNCHYDHEHKDDPNLVNDIFGPVGALYGAQEMSYPWQTPNENQLKHQGYGWLVRRDILTNDPKPHGGSNPLAQCNQGWCISDFRTQFHAIMGPLGAGTRFHSFALEARICRDDMSDCGFVRTGGWIDFGHLIVNGNRQVVPLAGDPPNIPASGAIRPVRLHCFGNQGCQDTSATWYGFHREPPTASESPKKRGPLVQTYGLLGESWAPVDPNNPSALNLFCPNFDCQWNGSRMEAHLFAIYVDRVFDQDGDGVANFQGYTNRYGTPVQGCTAPGLDCVPLEITNVPVRVQFQYRDDYHQVPYVEYDTSPPDENWITFPN